MDALKIVGAVLLVFVLAYAWIIGNATPYGDFDFGTGVVRCGVDHLSTSCGSVTR